MIFDLNEYIYSIDLCRGGSSFEQLKFLRDVLKLNDGLVLNHGVISYEWQNVMFWRTFVALFLHSFCLLAIQSLSLKLGFFKNEAITLQIEDIVERPADETVTAYSFIRQPFYHKASAANSYEKRKHFLTKRFLFC